VDPDPELGSDTRRSDSQEVINVPPHTPMLAPSPATSKKVQLVSKYLSNYFFYRQEVMFAHFSCELASRKGHRHVARGSKTMGGE